MCGREAVGDDDVKLTLRTVYDFATTTELEEIDFILEAKRLNEAAARSGMHENYGHQLGKTLCGPLGRGIMGDSIFSKVLSVTSCACDARMAGAMVPVMSNSGSGNQGHFAPPCPWWCLPKKTITPMRNWCVH